MGYDLLFLTNVYRAGSQIDRVVDAGQLPGGMAINNITPGGLVYPAATLDSSTLCVQGLNVGCTVRF